MAEIIGVRFKAVGKVYFLIQQARSSQKEIR